MFVFWKSDIGLKAVKERRHEWICLTMGVGDLAGLFGWPVETVWKMVGGVG